MNLNLLKRQKVFSLIRTLFVIFIFAILAIILGHKTLFVFSEQAFINTKLVTLRSPISGQVRYQRVDIGSLVNRNDTLFQITNPRFGNTEANTEYNNLRNRIDVVENEINQNLISIKRYKVDYKRFNELKGIGAVSKRDFEEIETELSILKASANKKKEQLQHLKKSFNKIKQQLVLQKVSKVVAPCDSVVWAILAKDGEYVDMGDEIIQLVNPEDVWVDAFFSERVVNKLYPGMKVDLYALGTKQHWRGEIVFIRGGSGRIMYNSAIEVPPAVLARRLVAVRIKVDWQGLFKASEFYGIGRSVLVRYPKNYYVFKRK